MDCILQSFYKELEVLSKEGIDFNIHGEIVNFKLSLALIAADTLAANQISGFKEGIGFSYRKCRNCMAIFDSMNEDFMEENFTLRNKDSHLDFFKTKNNTVLSGVNRLSALFSLDNFDVFNCIPYDPMHILLEGCIPYTVKQFLVYFIKVKKVITISKLNKIVSEFPYNSHDKSNKPSIILNQHILDTGNLRQSASQTWTLARLLPLMLFHYCDTSDPVWECLLLLLEITSIILSYEVNCSKLNVLKILIKKYLLSFKQCFPHKNIIPKQHFLVHIPTNLRNLGPSRTYWCMRFEAKHSYFKSLVSIANFKNIVQYMVKRHQQKFCLSILSSNVFQNYEINYKEKYTVSLAHKLNIGELYELNVCENDQVLKWLKFNNTTFKNKCCLFIGSFDDAGLPVFGLICLIVKHYDQFSLIIEPLKTKLKDKKKNCYVCEKNNEKWYCFKDVVDLKYLDVMSLYEINNVLFIPLKYEVNV